MDVMTGPITYLGGQELGQVVVESVTKHGVGNDADLFKVRRRADTLGPVDDSD